jgi:hypothetical protein
VAVKVFFAPVESVALPDLPRKFWLRFPNNVVPATSPWQAIAAHRVIPRIAGGASKIIGFEWSVPLTSATSFALLAVVRTANWEFDTKQLNIAKLITKNKNCGLRNVVVVNPSAANGPALRSALVSLSGTNHGKRHSFVVAQTSPHLLRAMLLSKRLARVATRNKIKTIEMTAEDKLELARVLETNPSLKDTLHTRSAFAVSTGALFQSLKLTKGRLEPMLFLINAKAPSGVSSIMQVTEDDVVLGGLTFQATDLG